MAPNTGAWKAFESRVAKKLGGRRTPLSGAMSGHGTSSDMIGSPLPVYMEAKWLAGKNSAGAATLAIWEDTVKKAKKEGKVPLLVMHRRSSRVEFAAMPLDLAAMLLKEHHNRTWLEWLRKLLPIVRAAAGGNVRRADAMLTKLERFLEAQPKEVSW